MSVANDNETTKIKESILIILTTRVSERVMERIGSNLLASVFENMDVTLTNILKYQIEQALGQWERRIKVTNIAVTYDQGKSKVSIRVDYSVLNLQIQDSTTVSFGGGR